MAARRRAAIRPLEAALVRLQTMAARGVQPPRMAREVEIIVGEWLGEADADPADVRIRLNELHEQLASGVVDADEAAAVKQAGVTLSALVATRDAVARARGAV